MDYSSVENQILHYPESSFEQFSKTAQKCVEEFSNKNKAIELIDNGAFELVHFHSVLNTLFHQVYNGASSFALAGSMCDNRLFAIREYFFHHAEEEQNHWKWIVQNLRDTGFDGPDPREVFPTTATQAYISFAFYLALKQPVSRLAMGYVLEGLSGNLGIEYGGKIAKQLGLTRDQMTFFLLHGELDQGHSHDILDVLEQAPLTPYEWAYSEYAAETTLHLYRNMYNHAIKRVNADVLV